MIRMTLRYKWITKCIPITFSGSLVGDKNTQSIVYYKKI
jgi:hypothetical protein